MKKKDSLEKLSKILFAQVEDDKLIMLRFSQHPNFRKDNVFPFELYRRFFVKISLDLALERAAAANPSLNVEVNNSKLMQKLKRGSMLKVKQDGRILGYLNDSARPYHYSRMISVDGLPTLIDIKFSKLEGARRRTDSTAETIEQKIKRPYRSNLLNYFRPDVYRTRLIPLTDALGCSFDEIGYMIITPKNVYNRLMSSYENALESEKNEAKKKRPRRFSSICKRFLEDDGVLCAHYETLNQMKSMTKELIRIYRLKSVLIPDD